MKGPQATVELPSGEQVPVKSLVIPPVKGRKVVLLGDTCDSHAILSASLPPHPVAEGHSFGLSAVQPALNSRKLGLRSSWQC